MAKTPLRVYTWPDSNPTGSSRVVRCLVAATSKKQAARLAGLDVVRVSEAMIVETQDALYIKMAMMVPQRVLWVELPPAIRRVVRAEDD